MTPWRYLIIILSLSILSLVYSQTQQSKNDLASDQNKKPLILKIAERKILINDKVANVYEIVQPDGTIGFLGKKGDTFNVRLENNLNVPTSVHWHGLILPNDQDGVAFITQFLIYPGQSYDYKFPLLQAGTFWMHSHFLFQEQKLLSAPLIVFGLEDFDIADQEVLVFLTDFSFRSPEEIFQELRNSCKRKSAISEGKMKPDLDIIDVKYDAFLANYLTLDGPDLIEVNPGKRVRVRFINASSSTNYFLSLGKLESEAVAVDGNRTQPLSGSQFELAAAQRIDVVVKIPKDGGAFPILAQGEGTKMQSGIILFTKDSIIPKLEVKAQETAGRLTNAQELKLQALHPLPPKPIDKKVTVELSGDMINYVWKLNGQVWPDVTPIIVEKGQRVEIVFKNLTMMSHPMHFHGHVFQVTEIDGQEINGAMRDTVLVTPNSTLSIQFDADNPGVWPLHCHLLYHLEGGMLTVVRYKDFIQRD